VSTKGATVRETRHLTVRVERAEVDLATQAIWFEVVSEALRTIWRVWSP
jgi:hypothetical protein